MRIAKLQPGRPLSFFPSQGELCIAGDFGVSVHMSEDDAVFIDSIYRGRYPAEAGLLPLGDPLDSDAKRDVSIVENTYTTIKIVLAGSC